MKKILVTLMAVLLIAAGCGSKVDDKTLVISGIEPGYGTEGWAKVIAAYEEETGVKVTLTMEKNIAEILRPQLIAGEAPDLVYLAINAVGNLTDTLIAEKGIMNISDLLDMNVLGEDVKVKDKVSPGFFGSVRTNPYADDKTYLAPVFYGPLGLFYNENLFTQKGWEVPTTWDEMFALGDKAAAEGIALFTYPTTGYFDGFFSSVLNSVVGPTEYTKLMNYDVEAWENPKTKEAFELVGKLAQYTHKDTVAQANKEGFTKNQQLVLDDKALFIPNGTWLPEEMNEAPRVDGFKWGFTALPAYTTGGDRYSSTFVEEVYIPEGAKNVTRAKEFITFLYSDKATELFYENGGSVQPIVGVTDIFAEDDANKLFFSVYDNGAKSNPVGFTAHDPVEGVDLSVVLYDAVNEINTGQKTVDQWYDGVVEAIKKFN